MKIIYPTSTGIAIITPTGEVLIEETARKDVPAGVPYLLFEDNALPTDFAVLNAMAFDFSMPSGHGSDYGVGTDWAVLTYDGQGRAELMINTTTNEIGVRDGEAVVIAEPEQPPIQLLA